MPDLAAAGCVELITVDRRTSIGDCTVCGFHGRPVDHHAYSVARQAGMSQVAAQQFAARHRRAARWAAAC